MNGQPKDQMADSERHVARLLEKVSKRVTLPAEQERVIRDQLRGEWMRVTGARKHKRRLVWAAAASLLVVISMVLTMNPTPTGDMNNRYVADIERRSGEILAYDAVDGSWEMLATGESVLGPGMIVATGDESRLAIRWHAGGMLRVDENSEFRVASNTDIELNSGRVYYDSQYELGGNEPYINLMIRTPLGVVRHQGTRFMTAVTAETLVVTVRDGEVVISSDPGGIGPRILELAMAGERVSVGGDGSTVTEFVDPASREFDWLNDIALSYQLEGKTASEFLDWVSGESGYAVEYASEAARAAAAQSKMHGDEINLDPLAALGVLELTTRLTYTIENNTILVEVRQ